MNVRTEVKKLTTFEQMEANLAARKARSTKKLVRGGRFDVIRYSERHLHEGHETEHYESLMDNPVEFTIWWWCHDCKVDFWYMSVEIAD